jgi:hypothetical protein
MKFSGPFILSLMACCENLATIQSACAGGRGTAKDVIKAYIACEDDIATIPAATNHVISTDITFEATKHWFEIDIDKVGSSFNFASQGEGQSKEYLNTAVLFVAGISADVTNALNSLIRGNANFLVKDKNGNHFLFGALGDGADVAITAQNDRNGYIITITYASANMPYFYTGAITLA